MKKFYFRVKEKYVAYVAAYGEDADDAWERVHEAASSDEIRNWRFIDRDVEDISEAAERHIEEGLFFVEDYPLVGDEQEEK